MALFGKDRFFDIKEPEQFFKALNKRKYWNSMRPVLLQRIFENTKTSPITMMDFVMISEQYDLVKQNYIFASKSMERDDDALSSISFTLFSLADTLIKRFEAVPKDSEEASLWPLIAIALEASLLCDPFQVFAYGSLGWFLFHAKLPEKAIAVCKRYDEAEKQLLDTEDNALSTRHVVAKERIVEARKLISSVKKELGLPFKDDQPNA